ncbi:MAG TPA: AAA family ATPase [Candidatus Paceibacterota bacterium]|nr:AAA family ATPase [Candidatus Paceibacterota bacterium]
MRKNGNGKRLNPAKLGDEAGKLEADLCVRVVGQRQAIEQVVNIYQAFLAGMSDPGRPIGNFLFLGPSGSGKTRLVEAVAESFVGDRGAVIKVDCAEFQHSHEIAKLIGSPPGYLGHRETHPLFSQEVLQQYYTEHVKLSFVLFDEIEKASDALWNLLLGILDKATLTLGDNRRVDFSHTMIFMTSNLGATEISAILRPSLGFAAGEAERTRSTGVIGDSLAGKISRAAIEATRRKFTPEFINRLDKIAVFHPLSEDELRQVLDIELGIVQQRVFHSANGAPFVLTFTRSAKDAFLREGIDLQYGARHLKRAINRLLVHPLCNLIATAQVHSGDKVKVDYDDAIGQIAFFIEEEAMAPYTMMQVIESAAPDSLAAAAGAERTRSTKARASRR